jgi:hypothetical protein
MKIYPNKSTINIKKEINSIIDIPLAYVDTTSSTYNISSVINDVYKTYYKKEVLPYDIVNTNICLFDRFDNQIDYEDMVKNFSRDAQNNYIYIPKGDSAKFKPKTFEYKIKVKKRIRYKSNMLYNINALFYNNKNAANKLMPIFGDAVSRGLAPGNISINNSDMSLSKLCESKINDSDITFLLLNNLTAICNDDGSLSPFDKKYYLNEYNTNFVFVMKNDFAIKDYDGVEYDSNKINLLFSLNYNLYSVSNPNIYSGCYINSKYYFNIPPSTADVKYYSLFSDTSKTPILIEEHVNNEIVVYITEDIINNAASNYKVLYEMLVYLYFNSYVTSDYMSDWIADVMPDYIAKDNTLIKKSKFISSLSVEEIFGLSSNEIVSINVIIDSDKYPFVFFDEIYKNSPYVDSMNIQDDYITFHKNKGTNNEYADPKEKPDGWTSLFINDEIFFFENFVYKINDALEDCVNVQKIDDSVVIDLKPFKHSDTGIFIKYNQEPIIIPLTEVINNIEQKILNNTYYLISKKNDSVSMYELLKKDDYTADKGIILMIINISQDTTNTEKTLYDMRQRGGGLPKDAEDNFDCFDIGNINGRPYREAGTLIITLPKYLEENKDIVMNIVKQYMVADDYPIIIFKED